MALLWSAVLAVSGGVLFRFGGRIISSRNPVNPLLLALVLGLIARFPWTADDRRTLRARVVSLKRWCAEANRHPGPDSARAWLVVAVGLAVLVTIWVMQLPTLGGDTGWFLPGTESIAQCMAGHQWFRCGTSATGTDSYVRFYPLFQHLPDLAFVAAGLTPDDRVIALSFVSIAAFFALLAAARLALRRLGDEPSWPAFIIVALTSPFLFYASSTWGEPLAAGLIVVFVAAALAASRPWTIGTAAAAAALTKETAFPFLGLVGTAALALGRQRTGRPMRPGFIAMTAGLSAGVGVSALFNLFRFGNPLNTHYLSPEYRVEAWSDRVNFFAGQLVSPNVGLAFHWTSASVLLALAICVPLVLRARGRAWPIVPALVLAALAGALTAMLSLWWAPYGGHAWGPRLSLPWVLGFVLYALAAYGPRARQTAARLLGSNLRLAGVAIVLLIVTLPQIGYLVNPNDVHGGYYVVSPSCPPDITIGTPEGWRIYAACMHYRTWERPSVLLDAVVQTWSVQGVAFSVVLLLTLCALLQLTRLSLRTRRADLTGTAGNEPASVVTAVQGFAPTGRG